MQQENEPRSPPEDSSSPSPPALTINLLPPELLYRVFAVVDDPQTLCRAERTCHLWRSIINSQPLWRCLAAKLASPRILPERLNQLGKGSLIAGRCTVLSDGSARWDYLYRDLVRAIHAFDRISADDYYRTLSYQHAPDSPTIQAFATGPPVVNVSPSMPELSPLPDDCAGASSEAYVTRKIDFTLSAVEGMRLQNRPLQISKTPPFTDCLCPGETTAEETAWVFLADQVPNWPRLDSNAIFHEQPQNQLHTTIQRGVIRAGTNGIFGEGWWHQPPEDRSLAPAEDSHTGDSNSDDENPAGTSEPNGELKDKSTDDDDDAPKRSWKVFTTRARSAALSSSSSTNSSAPANLPQAASDEKKDETPAPPKPRLPPKPIKWASAIDTARSLPHARRWDPKHSVYHSFNRAFNLSEDEQDRYESSMDSIANLTNSLYRHMRNQAHSDPNLRIVHRRVKNSFPEIVAARVERLALPPSGSLKRDEAYPKQPAAVVNQTWNLFGKAKWSLNSVPFLDEFQATELDGDPDTPSHSNDDPPDPWWFHETAYSFVEEQTDEEAFEHSNTWELRSCGDYLIISDDIGMSGPSTISCFKAGYHKEKADINPRSYLRGAALRNYLAAGPSSDLVWQRSMRVPGYVFDRASASPVRHVEDHSATNATPGQQATHPCYFLDQDGLALNSKVAVYATRKKVFYTLQKDWLMRDNFGDNLSCMEFHVISLENGQTLSILDLEHETRVLTAGEPWYGWTSFVVSDTHLLAYVGGNVHASEGAENQTDVVARTWKEERRYGREEIFVWPLDSVGGQNLSLPAEERKILPTGRLGVGFNAHKWWRRDRFLSLSRDGRFLCVMAKYDLIVWDLWDTKRQPVHYFFDKEEGRLKIGADGSPTTTADNVAWNGLWLHFRDVVVDPAQKSLTGSNPPVERELLRQTIFIPNSELRVLIDGADYVYQSSAAGQTASGDLERLSRRRYHPGLGDADNDRSSESEWDSDDDDDDDMDDSDWDFDDGAPMVWTGFSDDADYDDEEMYGEAGTDDGSYDSDLDEMQVDVEHVSSTRVAAAAAGDTGGETNAGGGSSSSAQQQQQQQQQQQNIVTNSGEDGGWGPDVSADTADNGGWGVEDNTPNFEDGW